MVVELFLIGVALSMDAFAVSMCKGLSMRKLNHKHAFVISLFFGGFQAIMPLIGWFLGTQFEQYIKPVDHWVAFALLAYIGIKMIWDATHEKDDEKNEKLEEPKLDLKELFLLAVATSIDALAIGITFAVLQTPIVPAITIIGLTTFCLSWHQVRKKGRNYRRCGAGTDRPENSAGALRGDQLLILPLLHR